ncbi:MAG: ATP-dependent DNA helicase [Propionibacteriaceae bacterium]|nr:ATP-dependent DNA helicase [Propionibacteriaceae bacterium]
MASLSSRLLSAAIEHMVGEPREGQEQMATAIDQAISSGTHLLVQAGTGTGKSLGYLAPAFAYAHQYPEAQVVIATATLALQTQLATKDIPTIVSAAASQDLDEISWCVLKGGSNYPCLLKIRDAPVDPHEQQYAIDDLELHDEEVDASSPLADQVLALRAWAEKQATLSLIADRDDAPSHSGLAWSHISLSGRECVGPVCPYVGECFVQQARDQAAHSQIVITNHALVAIEADHGWSTLNPTVLILDEAHELTARVTNTRMEELSPQRVERAVRLAGTMIKNTIFDDLRAAAERFSDAVEESSEGRVRGGSVVDATADLQAALRRTISELGKDTGDPRSEQVTAGLNVVYESCQRMTALGSDDVVWVSQRPQFGAQLVVAPLDVAHTIRESILAHQTSILTSATLKLGDSFDPITRGLGLVGEEESDQQYSSLDVGSPFDYPSQGICYVGAHLPPPGREGTAQEVLDEILDLVNASQGHALGLFSSIRAAERAAEHVRGHSDNMVVVQGEGHLPELIGKFLADPHLSLFGTLSLWQGLDAPGQTCSLVIVDRIPFPRPDEPLLQARQEHASRQGRNGFMEVAATHAGLMLAQGAGRLIRHRSDRGVVAILDPRLRTARYGGFLTSCLPPLWMTTSREVALNSLKRLAPAGGDMNTRGGEDATGS